MKDFLRTFQLILSSVRTGASKKSNLKALLKFRCDTVALVGRTLKIPSERADWNFIKPKIKRVNRPNRMEVECYTENFECSAVGEARAKLTLHSTEKCDNKSDSPGNNENILEKNSNDSHLLETKKNGPTLFADTTDSERCENFEVLMRYVNTYKSIISTISIDDILKCTIDNNCSNVKLDCKSAVPSVTQILSLTQSSESRDALSAWKRRKIMALGGENEFELYQRCLIARGNQFHECLRHLFSQGQPDVNAEISPCWDSVQFVLPKILNVKFQQHKVVHPQLCYSGVIDCIADIQNKTCIVEWKTTEKPKHSILDAYDYPIQVAAYLGACRACNISVTNGAIVYAVSDGSPATLFWLSNEQCQFYWCLWRRRLYEFWSKVKALNQL